MALACSSAILLSVASMVTRPSPCFRRKSEILSAGDAAAAARPLQSRTDESRTTRSDFMCRRVRDRQNRCAALPTERQALMPDDLRQLGRRRGVAAALGAHDAVDDGHADSGEVAELHA